MTGRRSVILISIDSLRGDHTGFLGNEDSITPTLDRLASDGLVFENAIAPGPATGDSVPVMFTGRFMDADQERSIGDRIEEHLNANVTLPERLSDHGYETIGFTANPWTSRYFGFDEGFDYFEDFISDSSSDESQQSFGGGSLVTQFRNWWRGKEMFMSWRSIYETILEKQRQAQDPYFLWIFLVDPHMPYLPDRKHRTRPQLINYLANLWLFTNSDWIPDPVDGILKEAYRNSIRDTDEFVGKLLDDVEDEPLVVLHSDHGEGFGEHGHYGHGPHLYEENIHVPLVVANGPTGTVSRPFSLRKLPDLTLDLALGRTREGDAKPYDKSRNIIKRAVRGDGWKYIDTPSDEKLLNVDEEGEPELENAELRELGREIVHRWRRTEKETELIAQAATEVTESV